MATFDVPHVSLSLGNAVNKMGDDYVYPAGEHGDSCYYNRPGCPQCIVGMVLTHLVPEYEPRENTSVLQQWDALKELGFTAHAVLMLQMAQSMQDDGCTWGTARDAAHHMRKILACAEDEGLL